MVVLVYIISLIYIKASSRMSAKIKHLGIKQGNNHGLKQMSSANMRFKKKNDDKESFLSNLLTQIRLMVKNPYMHMFVLRLCTFVWIYLYFCFQSIIPLFFLLHSVVYTSETIFLGFMKYLYVPGLWLILIFDYVVNIDNMWDDSIYTVSNYRYGIFHYEHAFPHLMVQLFTCTYACFVLYMFRDYGEDRKKIQIKKEEKERRKTEKRAKLLTQNSSTPIKKSSSIISIYTQDFSTTTKKKRKIFLYEIILRYVLKNIDILLMAVLYYAGCNRIDVYHVILLILFAVYIMYPDGFRRNFIFLLYFMSFIAGFK